MMILNQKTQLSNIIASTKNASLQYFVGGNQPVCSVPSSQNFVCNVYKNGQLISTQTNPSGSSEFSSEILKKGSKNHSKNDSKKDSKKK